MNYRLLKGLSKILSRPLVRRNGLAPGPGTAAIGLALPYPPLAMVLGFTALPWMFYGWVALVLVAYAATAGWAKARSIRATGPWL